MLKCFFALGVYFILSYLFSSFGLSSLMTAVLVDLLMIGFCLCFYLPHRTKPVKALKLTFRQVVMSVFFVFAVWCVSQMASSLVFYFTQDSSYVSYQQTAGGSFTLYVILTLFIAPVMEELLMRGIFFKELSKVSVWGSYCVSVSLFALLHGTLVHLPVAVLSGLLFCVVYDYTGELRYCVVIHSLYNFMALFVSLPFCSAVWFVCVVCFCYLLLFGALLFFVKKKNKGYVSLTHPYFKNHTKQKKHLRL